MTMQKIREKIEAKMKECDFVMHGYSSPLRFQVATVKCEMYYSNEHDIYFRPLACGSTFRTIGELVAHIHRFQF